MTTLAHRPRARRLRQHAQAIAEFALIAPFFFLILLAVIEGGRFIFYYETLSNATREGGRYAIVHGSNSSCPSGPMPPGQNPPRCYDLPGANVAAKVKSSAFNVFGDAMIVTTAWLASDGVTVGNNGRDNNVRVGASYTYRTLVPLLPLPPITITAESTLVVNN